MKHWIRRVWPAAAVLVVAAAGVVLLRWSGGELPVAVREAPSPRPASQAAEPETMPASAQRTAATGAPAAEVADAAVPEVAGEPPADEMVTDPNAEQDAIAAAWASVDMEAVRAAMPDNLYFKLAAPTKDEAVIEERAAERRRRNEEYGKVLSGTASEEEIGAFFDRRARVSTDYVEFTTYLLDHYRDTLHERDVALLELARRMHATRLQEIPRQVEEAMVRKQQQDEARAAWLAGEAEFQGEGNDPP